MLDKNNHHFKTVIWENGHELIVASIYLITNVPPKLLIRSPVGQERRWKEIAVNQENAARSLVDLVAYQEASVVSKTLIEKKAGTVTLFAFAKGQGLSEHTAPFDAMVCVLDGVAEISIDGNPITVRQGEMLVMPANKPHALKAVERFKMMLTMIRSWDSKTRNQDIWWMNMRKEYDFSKGKRGKFYRADSKLNIPIYLDQEVSAFVEKIALKKGLDRSSVVNELLRGDIKNSEAME
jgi:quercetin dioxygenase-like cupin family protein